MDTTTAADQICTAQINAKCRAAPTPNLDAGTGTIKTESQNTRDAYYALDVVKTRECGIKADDEANEGTYKTGVRSPDAVVVQYADWIFSKRTLPHWTQEKLSEFNQQHLGQRDWQQCKVEELREVTQLVYPCDANASLLMCFAVKTILVTPLII